MCIVQHLTIIHYKHWDNFISRRDGTPITVSAETDAKLFSWLKQKVIHNANALCDTGNRISKCKCCCDFNIVLWT